MNMKRETAGGFLLSILAGTIAAAISSGGVAQPTGAEAYIQSCLAPYRDELARWEAAQLDEAAYRRVVVAARAAAADSCSAFVERVGRKKQPGAEENPYLRNARALLEDTPEGRCIETRVVSGAVRSAESLYRDYLCHSGNGNPALLREAVEMDPGHLGALLLLTGADVGALARAEYAESLYRRSGDIVDRGFAAKTIMERAVDMGDVAAVQSIHERFNLDLLNEPPVARCWGDPDALGLMDVCLEAIESMAADALAADEALPDRVIHLASFHFWNSHNMIDLPEKVRSEAEVAEMLASPAERARLVADYSNAMEHLEIDENDDAEFAKLLRGNLGVSSWWITTHSWWKRLAWNPGAPARPRRRRG